MLKLKVDWEQACDWLIAHFSASRGSILIPVSEFFLNKSETVASLEEVLTH